MATPQLQQFFSSSTNPSGVGGDTGRNFSHTLPNPVGLSNCLALVVAYPTGKTVTITDNNGNTWPSTPSVHAKAGAGGFDLAGFVLPNANAGTTTITIGVGGTNIQPVSFEIYELNNIATSSPIDVIKVAGSLSGTGLSVGAMTTAISGDYIISAFYPNGNCGANPTKWTAGTGWTLMQADIAWASAQGFPKASQTIIQAAAGSITPNIGITGDSSDTFNGIAFALKNASAGTQYAAGCRILKHLEFTNNNQTASPWHLMMPTLGTCRLLGTTMANSGVTISSVTDGDGNSWIPLATGTFSADSVQAFVAGNTTVNGTLSVTVNMSAGLPNGIICSLYDIVGAASSPIGASASHGLLTTNGTSVSSFPSFTPQSLSGSLIFYWFNNQGTGSGQAAVTTAVTVPTGTIWDGVNFTGKTGGNQFDFGDGWAHLNNNTSTATQSVTWTLGAISGNNVSAGVLEILPASSGDSFANNMTRLMM